MTDLVELLDEYIDVRTECYHSTRREVCGCVTSHCELWRTGEGGCKRGEIMELMRLGAKAKEQHAAVERSCQKSLGAIKEAFPNTTVGIMRNVAFTGPGHQEDAPDTFNEMIDPFKEDLDTK